MRILFLYHKCERNKGIAIPHGMSQVKKGLDVAVHLFLSVCTFNGLIHISTECIDGKVDESECGLMLMIEVGKMEQKAASAFGKDNAIGV